MSGSNTKVEKEEQEENDMKINKRQNRLTFSGELLLLLLFLFCDSSSRFFSSGFVTATFCSIKPATTSPNSCFSTIRRLSFIHSQVLQVDYFSLQNAISLLFFSSLSSVFHNHPLDHETRARRLERDSCEYNLSIDISYQYSLMIT